MPSQSALAGDGLGLNRKPGDDAYFLWRSNSPSMQPIEHTIVRIARTNIPILLTGESGTGKEALAHHIHRLSSRCEQTLVREICASSSAESLAGYFQQDGNGSSNGHATTGTLFLKEICELEAESQRAVLYSLPAADLHPEHAAMGPRVISSTTRNLEEEIRAGRFRTELYYRINGVCLHLPPLRQRKEDIPALVELFLTKHSALLCQPRIRLGPQDLRLLGEHTWPGNIRELENIVRNMVVLNESKSVLSKLGQASVEPSFPRPAATKGSVLKAATRAASRAAERQLILDALNRTRWNRKRAAQELQISYKSLLYKLKEIGTEEENGPEEGSAAR